MDVVGGYQQGEKNSLFRLQKKITDLHEYADAPNYSAVTKIDMYGESFPALLYLPSRIFQAVFPVIPKSTLCICTRPH